MLMCKPFQRSLINKEFISAFRKECVNRLEKKDKT